MSADLMKQLCEWFLPGALTLKLIAFENFLLCKVSALGGSLKAFREIVTHNFQDRHLPYISTALVTISNSERHCLLRASPSPFFLFSVRGF